MYYINTDTLAYPITEAQIRAEFPDTSFPFPFVAPDGYAFVFPTAKPTFNPISEGVRELPPEEATPGTYEQRFEVYQLPAEEAAANLAAERTAFIRQIDADTDAIYRAVQGDRGPEYALAEADAKAYAAAGYTGTVPVSVSSWATAKGQTNQWAADDILATATAWRTAQGAIRSNRLARKEAARVATDLAPIKTQWSGFVSYIRSQLGVA